MSSKRSFDPDLLTWSASRRDPSKRPLFALSRRDGELFFVNHSADVLAYVSSASIGVVPDVGDSAAFTSPSKFHHEAVQPGEAVKIDQFNEDWDHYEREELIISEVILQGPAHGRLKFRVARKGGALDMVLLWQDGFVSPHCSMCRLDARGDSPTAT